MAGAGVQNAVGWVQGGLAITPTPYTKAAAVALTALQYGCSFDPGSEGVDNGCWERATPTFVQYFDPTFNAGAGAWLGPFADKDGTAPMSSVSSIISFDGYVSITNPGSGVTQEYPVLTLRFSDGSSASITGAQGYFEVADGPSSFRLSDNGSACEEEGPPQPGPDPVEPITGFSPELNCTITAELKGFRLNDDGTASPVIVYKTDQTTQTRNGSVNDDPIVQNCNWYGDLVYTGPSNCDCPVVTPLPDPPVPIPAPPEPGACPDPCPEPEPEPLDAEVYRMQAACNIGPDGQPLVWEDQIAATPGLEGIALRLKALNQQISQALLWKTPICPPERPDLLGDWVTVRFESLDPSPQGTRPLRKLFRYRSQSAYDLGQKAAYWESFTWNAGAVCVQHKGAWWGTPQCWAQNADEGKRVIRFAGLEAGIDPDSIGEWVISGSSDPRFGMPGSMRVAKVEGLEWITSRQGPSGLPLLTVDP